MATDSSAEQRRHPRIGLHREHPLEVELDDGRTVGLIVSDISEGGMGFTVPSGTAVIPNSVMAIGIEQVINLQGRVRWVNPDPAHPEQTRLGVEFESLSVQPKSGTEIQEMVNAWMEISHSYSVLDGFLHILDMIDDEILDGHIQDFSDALNGISLWTEQRIGTVNLWQVIRTSGEPDVQLLVQASATQEADMATRAHRVQSVAESQVTSWFDQRPYIYGESLVIECMGGFEGKLDLLHKVAAFLGRRVRAWTKLLTKNVALQFMSEEISRYRQEEAERELS